MKTIFGFFKISILLLAITVSSAPSFAQESVRDSLRQEIATLQEDTSKANTLIELAFEMRDISSDSVILLARQAYDLAVKLEFPKGQAQAVRNIGLGYKNQGNQDSAFFYCKKAIEIAQENDFSQIEADAYNTIGNMFFRQSEYDSARLYFEESLAIFELLDNTESIAISNANIGVIYSEQGKYSKALEVYQDAWFAFEKVGNNYALANTYNNIANIYLEREEMDKAYDYYLKTSYYDSITGNKTGRAHTLLNLGNVLVHLDRKEEAKANYLKSIQLATSSGAECISSLPRTQLGDLYLDEGQYDSAYKYISLALAVAKKCNYDRDLTSVYLDLGEYHSLKGQLQQAKTALLNGYRIAEENDIKPKMEELSNALYKLYEKQGDFSSAFKYLKISNELRQELFDKESTERITRLEAEYEFEKEKQQIRAEQEKRELAYERELFEERIYLAGAAVMIVLIGAIAILLLRGYRIKRAANEQLVEKNQQLTELREKEKQLSEEALSSKDRELATMAMASLEKNKLLTELNQKVSFLEKRMSDDLKPSLKEMRKTISDSISLDSSWDSFIHRFEDVHPQFFDRLKNENPNLTINDLKLSAYLKIGMSNKEIANVSHLTLGSVKSSINRLKKKLELRPEDSVRDFILQYA